MAMNPLGLTLAANGGMPDVPSKEELDSFQRVWAYLQIANCGNTTAAQPGVRRAVDSFNELVDPATMPLDPRAFFLNACNPCGTGATGGNKAADLYAAAMLFFQNGAAYYAAETPTETPEPSVADQLATISTSLAAIQSSIGTIETDIANLQGRVTALEGA